MKLPIKTRDVTFNVTGQYINNNTGHWTTYVYAASNLKAAREAAEKFNGRADYRGMVANALVHLEPIPVMTEAEVAALKGMEWSTASVLHIESDEEFKHLSEQFDAQRKQIEELKTGLDLMKKRYQEMKEDRDSYRTMFDQLQINRAKVFTAFQKHLDQLHNIIEEEEDDE